MPTGVASSCHSKTLPMNDVDRDPPTTFEQFIATTHHQF
jgi:hypothetical protein